MHIYQLDDKKTDQAFINGENVSGKAVLSTVVGDPPKEGDALLVILSNGKKYKAQVTKVALFVLNEYYVGEIEFIKSSFYQK